MNSKICLSCKIDKPLDNYTKVRKKKDGLDVYCKACKKLARDNYGHSFKEKKVIKDIPEISKWIQENYNQLIINTKKVCGAGFKYWGEDLLPFIIQELMEKPVDYQLKIYKDDKLEEWITKSMAFQLQSSTSPFYYQYRRNLINERSAELNDLKQDHNEYSALYEDIEKLILNVDFEFKDALYAVYIEGKELKTYCRENNINYYKAKKQIPKIFSKLKKEIIKMGYEF